MEKKQGNKEETARKVICLGQAVIDCVTMNRLPVPGRPESAAAESIVLRPGGDAVNESMALGSLGREVKPVFAVGEDAAGALLIRAVEEKGIDTSGIVRMGNGFETPIANIFVERDGSRSSISSKAVTLPGFRPSAGLLKEAEVVSLCSLFRAPLDDPEVLAELVIAAKAQGSVVCADTKLPLFKKITLADYGSVFPHIDFIFPNESEAAFYSGRNNYEEMADAFLSQGVRHVVIKAGAEGCYAKDAEGFFHVPAVPVKAVNTTGAGDWFAAGFIAGLLDGLSFRECCEAGTVSASKKIIRG